MKKLLISFWLVILLFTIGALFWYNQYRYSLPTPVPNGYKTVKSGTFIHLTSGLNLTGRKPVLLHFFNPDCPCSRFNLQHVKSLIKQYHNSVDFALVLVTAKPYTAQQIQDKFDLQIPVIADKTLATACGVYSTPQAVLLKANRQLYYRGNYNSSRYCTNKKTEYARMALENLLHGLPVLNNPLSTTAYGCRFANNNSTYAAQ
ncbi:thioredoxin fold domain-containing protein [Mucilaginibacter sp. PAMB04274]|uniref:DUF6436 domain-containing protein n=1 Tax=Mucilaginibacter sp. PAMB04274 TaxID=3138568 RepID=UPI0031F5F845